MRIQVRDFLAILLLTLMSAFISCIQVTSAQNETAQLIVQNETINATSLIPEEAIVSLTTNKRQYIPGETVQISGQLFSSSDGSRESGVVSLRVVQIDERGEPLNDMMLYEISTYAVNGSFSDSGFSTQSVGNFKIGAIATELSTNVATTDIQVISPIFTIPYIMLALAVAYLAGLMIVIIYSRKIEITTGEVLRLIFITGAVVSPIIGLLFSDSEYGVNSPIGLITTTTGDASDQVENEWVINVGGTKADDYATGILIPVYVIVFGLTGGYLRYLYKTASMRFNLETSGAIRNYLFNWSKVPQDASEVDKLKQYLVHNFGLDWVTNSEVTRDAQAGTITIVSKDQDERGQFRSILMKLDKNKERVSVMLGGSMIDELRTEVENDNLELYQITDRRSWVFYQSMGDLALLGLAPLLAIAAWFLLTRGGEIDKYVVAVVSFTVGLVTDRIVSYLIGFTSSMFKSGEPSKPISKSGEPSKPISK